jgi:hypothetical protein
LSKNIIFYTFFSETYLPYAYVLFKSLFQKYPEARVLACGLDAGAMRIKKHFPSVEMFDLEEVKSKDPGLSRVLKSRSGASAIFTCAPSIALHALGKTAAGEVLFYLDADTALFSGVDEIIHDLKDKDTGLFPHRFSRFFNVILEKYGKYNAGAFIIRNSQMGFNFLIDWRAKCLEWCEDRVEGDKYSNQGYLNNLSEKYQDSTISLIKSAGNIAPWNAGIWNTRTRKHIAHFHKKPIIFFHFHGLTKSVRGWEISHLRYGQILSRRSLNAIYSPYLVRLEAASEIFGIQIRKSERFESQGVAYFVDFVINFVSTLMLQYIPNKWLLTENQKQNR